LQELPRKLHEGSVVVVVVVVGTLVVLVVGGRVDVVVATVGIVVDEVVDVDVVVGGCTVDVVLDVVGVEGRVLVVVGRGPGGRVVLVVLGPASTGGHASGAGALCATKRPGLSLPILPPNRKQ